MERPPEEVLEGTVEQVVYADEATGFAVVRLSARDHPGLVTAVGNLLGVHEAEPVRLVGRWVQDRRYGEQFKVQAYHPTSPATLKGLERYLGSGLVPGIGKAMAARLVGHFRMQALAVLDREPERLREVDGIGPIRAGRIQAAWTAQRGIREVMIFLQSHGVSPTWASRIFKQYGNRTIALVRENPYRLALEVHGIGFLSADRIAQDLGVAKDSPRRAEAGLLHALEELASEGHVYCPGAKLLELAAAMLGVDAPIVERALGALDAQGLVVVEPQAHGEAVYLRELHAHEAGAAGKLRGLLATPVRPIRIDLERAIAWLEEHQGIRLARGQQEAVRQAAHSKVLVVTGGPGTGKTTVLRSIIQVLEMKGRRVLLCAPTGRAAKRMAEATGREARTIHRLLEFDPKHMRFGRDAERPLEVDLVVVDEVSMVDIALFHALLAALPASCQLVLVGDVDQLPSVGPGHVLRELIASGAIEVVILDEVFRQAERSRIVVAAHRINHGQLPEPGSRGPGSDFRFVERAEPDGILEALKELVSEALPREHGFDPLDDIQVLAPMHKGLLGTANLNAELQALLNPPGQAPARGPGPFRLGDKVMQIRNDYQREVWNGDIGRVVAVDAEEKTVDVRFEERVVTYGVADLDELVLAYACSIHKSQGSEYPAVVIPLHTQHYTMLQRNLLYTGITRGRRLVVLVGSKRAVSIAVRNDRIQQRYTRLAERLNRP